MLVITAIVCAGACVYVVSYAVLNQRMGQRMAALSVAVKEEVDEKSRQSRELDVTLARHVADGRSVTTEIQQWQRKRAEMLPHGQHERPWAWSAGDLKRWAREQLEWRADDVRRRHILSMVTATVCVLVVTGGSALAYYQFYSARQNTPLWDANYTSGMPAVDGAPGLTQLGPDPFPTPAGSASASSDSLAGTNSVAATSGSAP